MAKIISLPKVEETITKIDKTLLTHQMVMISDILLSQILSENYELALEGILNLLETISDLIEV